MKRLLVFASMLIFLFTVIRRGFGPNGARVWTDAGGRRMAPAE